MISYENLKEVLSMKIKTKQITIPLSPVIITPSPYTSTIIFIYSDKISFFAKSDLIKDYQCKEASKHETG